MARIFNASDFDQQPAAASTPTAPRTFTGAEFDMEEALPDYANGLSPQTPINKSPISLEDRARLSVGNEAGKMKYLREKFGQVQKTKEGDLVVNNNGFWQRVDAEGLGDGDAWSMTRELMSDVLDVAPTAANIGAQIGIGVATGGTSLPVQAAAAGATGGITSALETSLGRLVGTYDATPEEQLKDIAIESVLNLGGTYVAAGVKPTLNIIADGLSKGAKVIGQMAPANSKAALKELFGNIAGTGAKNIDTLIAKPDAVSGAMKSVANAEDPIAALTKANIDDLATITRTTRQAVSNYYDEMAREVVDNVPDTFQSNLKQAINNSYSKLEQLGVGAIDPKTSKFIPFTEKELQQKLATSGDINPLLTDESSRKMLMELTQELSKYNNARELTGKAGAKQLMDFRKTFFDLTWKMKSMADEASLPTAQRAISAIKEVADNTTMSLFNLKQPVLSKVTGQPSTNLFADLNKVYNQTVTEVAPLLRAAGQAQKQASDLPIQSLYNQLSAMSGRNEVQKSAFDKAIAVLGQYGGAPGKAANSLYDQIQVREAAKAFTPLTRKGLNTQAAAGFTVGSLAAGSPMAALGAAASSVATSPRVQYTLIKAAMKGKQALAGMTPAQKGAFLSDPRLVDGFVKTIINAPSARQAASEQLVQQGVQSGQQ